MKISKLLPLFLVCSFSLASACINNAPVNTQQTDVQVKIDENIIEQLAQDRTPQPPTSSPSEVQSSGKITGILNNNDQGPLINALVRLENTSYSTQTDDIGQFALQDIPSGKYNLVGEKTDSQGQKFMVVLPVEVQKDKTTDISRIKINKTGMTIGLAQLEGETDHTGVNVYIPGTSYASFTEQTGDFTLVNIPSGIYDLAFSKPGYQTVFSKGIQISPGGFTQIDPVTLSPTSENLNNTGQIKGVISDGASPIAGVSIVVDNGPTAITDETGNFLMHGLKPGPTKIFISRPGFNLQILEVVVDKGMTLTQNIELQSNLVTLGQINGQVLDENGEPVKLAAILTQPNTNQTITDNEGRFTLTQIYPGDYVLSAVKASKGSVKAPVSLERGQKEISVVLQYTANQNETEGKVQ